MRWCKTISIVIFLAPLLLNGQVRSITEIAKDLQRADSLFEIEHFEESFTLYSRVYKEAQKTNEKRSEAYALKGLGNIAYMFSDLNRSEEYYRDALSIFKEIEDRRGEIKILINLGNIYSEKGEREKAMKSYRKALKILGKPEFSESEDSKDEVAVLGNIGNVYEVSYELDSALYYYNKAFDLSKEIQYKKGEGDILHNIGNIYFLKNQYDVARTKYTESKEIFKKMGNIKGVADNLRELGAVERKEGRYAESLLYLEESLGKFRELRKKGNIIGEGEILNNIALVYFDIGKYEESLKYLKEIKDLYEGKNDSIGLAIAMENLGSTYFRLIDYEEDFSDSAVAMFEKSLEILKKKNKKVEEADVINNIGLVFQKAGKIDEALKKFTTALEKYHKVKHAVGQAKAFSNIGNIYMIKEDYGKAIKNYEEANALIAKYNLQGFRATILASLGIAYKKAEIDNKSIDVLVEAVEIIEDIRGTLGSQELKSTFIEDKIRIYEELIDILLKKGKIKEAFRYVERSKSRALLDMLGQKDIELKAIPEKVKELVRKERILSKKIEFLSDDEERRSAFFEHQRIMEKLKEVYPEYHSLRVVEPIDLASLQKNIDTETIVLEYFLCHSGVYLFAVDNKTVSAQKLNYTPEQLYDDVVWLRRYMYGQGDWESLAYSLYNKLVSIVQEEIEEKKRVCIIPHGILHHLPYNALLVEREPQTFFVEIYDLCYAPSSSILMIAREKNKGVKKRSIIFAKSDFSDHPNWANLEGTIKEADELVKKKLLPGVKTYKNEKATEYEFKKVAGNYDILHLATHGQLNVDDPLRSRILLTPTDSEDGSLTIPEIFGLNLSSYLVTLSACETGEMGSYILGKEFSAGDDLVGLTRSFIFAGSPSVVASLWFVIDAAAVPLMVEFYANLKKYDKAKSLCEAQRYMIKESDFPSPKFWSPFVLFGDWE